MDVVAPEFGDELADGFAVLEGVPVNLHLLFQYLDRIGRGRQHTNAFLGGQTEAVLRGAGQVQARVRLLEGLGQDPTLGHAPVLALVLVLVRGPDLGQHADGFVPEVASLPGVDAQAGLLVGVGTARTDLDPAVGQLVQQRHALGDANGVVIGQDADAVADADLLGDAAQGAEYGILGG